MIVSLSHRLASLRWRAARAGALARGAVASLINKGPRATLNATLGRLAPPPGVSTIPYGSAPEGDATSPLLLFIDAAAPTPDRDSGSVRALRIMQICSDMGWRIVFMPDNGQVSAASTRLLADAGIRVIGIAGQLRLDQWLAAEGHRLHAAFLARHHVATRHIALIRALSKAQVLFDTVDLHHIRLQRAAELQNDASAARTAERVRSEEMRLIDAADTTLVVSGTEVDYLHTQGVTRSRISVLSNIHDPQRNSRSYADTRDLLFVGGFLHHPNREAVEWLRSQVMPLLRLRLAGITLHVVGDMPDEDAQRIRCADIQVHGHVATLEPHLAAARISLAPLLSGAGVKGKINQAMSHGLPVVATSIAAEGMFLQHGHDALIADGATAFAAEVARLYEDEQLWMKLSGNGYDNVEKHFSSDLARSTLLQLIGHPDRMGPTIPHP